MQRLFFKVYSTVIVLTVLAFFLMLVFVINPALHPSEWDDFQQETGIEYRLLIPQLRAAPNETQARRIITRYQPVFDLKVSALKPAELSSAQQKKLAESAQNSVFSNDEDDDWYAYYQLPHHELGVLIEETGFSWVEARESIFLVLIIPFILIMMMLATALILAIRWLSRPLLQLEAATARFGAGDMSTRITDASHSPISSLAGTFNHMAGKIESLVHQQQVMIGAIPHELRTPLNRIRFALDLSRNKQDMAGLHSSIEHIDEYVEELTDSVSEILEFSRLQHGGIETETMASVHLLSLLNKASHYCGDTGKNIAIECDPDLYINAHPELLNRALLNLVLNASRYAAAQITLKAFLDTDDSTVIQVDDDGEGIAKEHYQQIFSPFFRIDTSRNRATGGIGLGLALVQLIIEKHGGTIQAKDAPKRGLRMEIRLQSGLG